MMEWAFKFLKGCQIGRPNKCTACENINCCKKSNLQSNPLKGPYSFFCMNGPSQNLLNKFPAPDYNVKYSSYV